MEPDANRAGVPVLASFPVLKIPPYYLILSILNPLKRLSVRLFFPLSYWIFYRPVG